VKGLPLLAFVVVPRPARARGERRWLESALRSEVGRRGLTAAELGVLLDPRARRRARREVGARAGRAPRVCSVGSSGSRSTSRWRCARHQPEDPALVRQRDYCKSLPRRPHAIRRRRGRSGARSARPRGHERTDPSRYRDDSHWGPMGEGSGLGCPPWSWSSGSWRAIAVPWRARSRWWRTALRTCPSSRPGSSRARGARARSGSPARPASASPRSPGSWSGSHAREGSRPRSSRSTRPPVHRGRAPRRPRADAGSRDRPGRVHPLDGHPRPPGRHGPRRARGRPDPRRVGEGRRDRRDRRCGTGRGGRRRGDRHDLVVVAPGWGDAVQVAKAGILEIGRCLRREQGRPRGRGRGRPRPRADAAARTRARVDAAGS